MGLKECIIDMKAVRAKHGYSNYREAFKITDRERLQVEGRPERIHFPPAMYQRLFNDQEGLCPECQSLLEIPAKRNEIDHRDPNRVDGFNKRSNLQLLHKSCNREKSASSVQSQSKGSGKTFEEILR